MLNTQILFVDCESNFNLDILAKEEFEPYEQHIVTSNTGLRSRINRKLYITPNLLKGLPPELGVMHFKRVYLVSDAQQVDNLGLLQNIYALSFDSIYRIDTMGNIATYQPYQEQKAKILMIFPGIFIPLRMGSHQRAYNMIQFLNNNQLYTDLLLPLDRHNETTAFEKLCSLAPKVYFYKNKNRPYRFFMRIRRAFEITIRTVLNKKGSINDLFSERNFRRPSIEGKQKLSELLRSKNYHTVIIHYAWMIPINELVQEHPEIKWICDTHDVQFIRNQNMDFYKQRLFVNWGKEKKLELANLRRMDKIIAISESDMEHLANYFPSSKLVLCSTGFDYAYQEIKKKDQSDPFIFGFIGGGMNANIISMIYVLDTLWPKILDLIPGAKLKIAGAICYEEEIVKRGFLDDSIERYGFISNLSNFYDAVDVILSPVFVQGGLNFKNVEALLAGKHLITNHLGAKPLKSISSLLPLDTVDDVLNYLKKCLSDPNYDFEIRTTNQKYAFLHFTSKNTYKFLLETISE